MGFSWPCLISFLWLLGCDPAEQASSCPEASARKLEPGCSSCHADLVQAWSRSPHARALGDPRGGGILGDFSVGELRLGGRGYRLGRSKSGIPWIEVEDGKGKWERYEVVHSLGHDPLQQYLLRFSRGRFQVPPIAWDARPKAEGGQRWFALSEARKPEDPLHWKGRFFTANGMCLECHVTGYRKGFDPEKMRYTSRWDEGGVRCAACHPKVPSTKAVSSLDLCGSCHARRLPLRDGAAPGSLFLDEYVPRLLEEPLYRPDGGIQDEVFVYGSFVQSRMHQAGVGCLDCHDPHSLQLKAPGNALCLRCHKAETFDRTGHHLHSEGSEAARCVTCHMPARTYMGIDPRRDHGLRVPRPDLAEASHSPSVCMGCHKERGEAWAAEALSKAHPRGRVARGGPRLPYGPILAAARRGEPGAAAGLARLIQDPQQAPIVRATALLELPRLPLAPEAKARALSLASEAMGDTHPLVRRAALGALGPLAPRLAPRLLDDPLRSVRVEAARVLARGEGKAWERAFAEYRASLAANADRPGAWLQRAILEQRRGELAQARASCRKSLALDPGFAPALVNWADLLRMENKDLEGLRLLEGFRSRHPGAQVVWQAEVLTLVRLGRRKQALDLVRRALRRFPGSRELLLYQNLLEKKK